MKKFGRGNLNVAWRSALCAVAMLFAGAAMAQNDNYANAIELIGDYGTVTNDTTGFTAELNEPNHAAQPAAASAWYKWVAPYDGLVTVDTIGSAIDSLLGVYTGANGVGSLSFVAANDDFNDVGGPSLVKFNARAGQTYYFAVDGWGGDEGPVSLSWAYHSAGVFRFSVDSRQSGYITADTEGQVRVTVTRIGGAAGRTSIDLNTVDGVALGGLDYEPISTTLVFDDWEISKSIYIPIYYDFLAQDTRDFAVTISLNTNSFGEPTYIMPARIDPNQASAPVFILDADTDPGGIPFPTFPAISNGAISVITFASTTYRIPEDGSAYLFPVYRTGGDPTATVSVRWSLDAPNGVDNLFQLQAGSDYATPFPEVSPFGPSPDFSAINDAGTALTLSGTLTWGPGEFGAQYIVAGAFLDGLPEFNEDFTIGLQPASAKTILGNIPSTTVTILYNDYPAGALDTSHNPDYALFGEPPGNTVPGANYPLNAVLLQPDGKALIAGDFTAYNATPRNRIARADVGGNHDLSFNPGSGANDYISCLALVPSGAPSAGSIIIGGGFTSFNGQQRYRIARLDPNGGLDNAFNPGLGADAEVWTVAVQSDGKVLLGGAFTSVDGYSRPYLARLNSDGSVDTTFDMSAAPLDGYVESIVVDANGKIYIGGEFTMVGGASRNRIARLNSDGSLDATYNPRTGFNGAVFTLAQQLDGKIIAGGTFDVVDLRPRRNLARLNNDGTLDTTFAAGAGADDAVFTIALPSDGKIYIGGKFTSFNQTRRVGVARLFADGTVDTSFMDTAYNNFAGVPNPPFYTQGETPQNERNQVLSLAVQADGNVVIAGKFSKVGGGRLNSDIQPRLAIEDTYFGYSRAAYRNRQNFARLIGGSTVGAGNISLAFNNYYIDESAQFAFIQAVRENGSLGRMGATFSVPEPGNGTAVAQPTTDYTYNGSVTIFDTSWFITRSLSDGLFGTNLVCTNVLGDLTTSGSDDIFISIPHRSGIQGNRNVGLRFDVPTMLENIFLGGENMPVAAALGAKATADFQINEVDTLPGVISFSSASYQVNEGGSTANYVVNLVRTNGSFGTVSVIFNTTNATAIAGTDYTGVTNTVTFQQGITNKTVSIPIKGNSLVQPDRVIRLVLRNPSGGATLGLADANLTIVDDDYLPGRLTLTSSNYVVGEYAGTGRVTVNRQGGSTGVQNVQLVTLNGTALAGTHYTAVTNLLSWNNGESGPRNVDIPLLPDTIVTSNLQFGVRLQNASDPNSLTFARTNAVVTIVNGDAYGSPQFSAPNFYVSENAGFATVTVIRTSGSSEAISVNFTTVDNTAVSTGPLPNFVATNGTLIFGPGVVSRSIQIPVFNDGVPNTAPFNFKVLLSSLAPSGATLGAPTLATVNMVDAQSFNQPAGSVDPAFDPSIGFNEDIYSIVQQPGGRFVVGGAFTTVNGLPRNRLARLFDGGTEDSTFMSGLSGANDTVRAVYSLSDTRLLVGGYFTTFNSVNRNRLTRLNTDGTLDTTFDPGSGADAPVLALAEGWVGTARKMYVAGEFTTFDGVQRPRLVRLNDDGKVDLTFGQTTGVNGPVYAIAVYATNTIHAGKVLIGGAFSQVNGVSRTNIARLNTDGTLDTTFNPGTGADAEVRALLLQLDGKVVLGGAFTHVGGQSAPRISRLNLDGTVDGSFNIGDGANGTVYCLALQADGRILAGGDFSRASGVTRRCITRFMTDGTVDPSINFGSGANAFVTTISVQPDEHILLGGGFTAINGELRSRMARVFGGSMTGSGQIQFASAYYTVNEDATNAVITFKRIGGTAGSNPDGSGSVSLNFSTANNTAIAGVNYDAVNQPVAFPVGEVETTAVISVHQDLQITDTLMADLSLSGDPSLMGPQPIATLFIVNVDSAVHLSASSYVRNEDAIDGAATITIIREGSSQNASSVTLLTTTNGTAAAGVNYLPVTNVVTFLPGQTVQTVKIPVLRDPNIQGDLTVGIELALPFQTVLLSPSAAVLTIRDVDQGPGQLIFSASSYSFSESAGGGLITILRTNGSQGIVTVAFTTIAGTALPGSRYVSTNGILTFADGQISRTISLPLIGDNIVQGNQVLTVQLSNPTGGALLGAADNVPVTVVDDDVAFSFGSAAYVASETNAFVFVTVQRVNGSNGVATVNFQTVDGSAKAGTNYTAYSTLLTFGSGETVKSIGVPLLYDPRVIGNLTFSCLLTNPSAGVQLGQPNPAVVVVVDSDVGIGFSNATASVLENATNLTVTVIRVNPGGTASVNYATEDVTAVAGQDYTPVSGSLVFLGGEIEKTITVPIPNNQLVQGDRTFNINLFNPVNGQLISPSTLLATIVDDDAGLRFSSGNYQIYENAVSATITVLRAGYTNSSVSVDYSTADGSGVQNVNYFPASGTLTFANGEVSKTFDVVLKDDNLLTPDRTVLLSLQNPSTNAAVVDPGAATLFIGDDDGSLIIPAGTALVSETINNGIVDPGETLTVLFGFRNSGGLNAGNVTATLLATNGVTPITTAQNYGAMAVGAPVTSRSFTFVANGTNGQTITANFALSDNGSPSGSGLFNFTVGTTTDSFSNSAVITITDRGASPTALGATPYPSTVNVSGVSGTITATTLTLSNYSHVSAGDVGALLVAPTGQKTLLMANAGGFNSVSGLTLTFSDSAPGNLPLGSAFGSGTYKPTSYAPVSPFPAPAPASGYSNTLSAFNASNPNGVWSLYVMDDTSPGAGSVAAGWWLTITRGSVIPSAADMSIGLTASGAPLIAGSQMIYTLRVTNNGPAAATSVQLTNTLPVGVSFVSATPSVGSANHQSGIVVWSIGNLANGSSATLSIAAIPSLPGTVTNSAVVSSGVEDVFAANNTTSLSTVVVAPTSDLIVTMEDAPDPVAPGWPVTYSVVVTNLGPAVAPSVAITNILPVGLVFGSVSSSQGASGFASGTVWANLGSLNVGAFASVTIVARPTQVGLVTNTVTATGSITDPLKANNTAAVKTTVVVPIAVTASGGILTITTLGLPGTVLESTTSLSNPVWTTVMVNPPTIVNLPIGTGSTFYRVRPVP